MMALQNYFNELPSALTLSDTNGKILYMKG